MKARKTLKRLTGIIAAFVFAVSLGAPVIGIVADAADVIKVENFAAQSVTEDLSDIDLSVYPVNEKGAPQVIRAQEFCYSENEKIAEYYGLYLYIYNPSARSLMNQCYVNMAVSYNESGNPSDYDNVQLDICNYTEDKLFYKFKVKEAQKFYDMAREYAAENLEQRRYDIAGITLVYSDLTKKTDNDVSKTYYFEGYASGCGEDQTAESTLTCTVDGLDTIHLKLKHTNYIAETPSDADNYIYDQVHTAYFSIPEEYFEQCGELQGIEAEWYEYKTAPIFVTWDADAYDALLPYVGKWIGEECEDLDWKVFWEQRKATSLTHTYVFDSIYNKTGTGIMSFTELGTVAWGDALYLPRMSFLHYVDKDNRYISSDDLLDEMKSNRFTSSRLVNGYPFEYFSDIGVVGAEDIFEEYGVPFMNKIDENRINYLVNPSDGCGYVSRKIDASEVGVIKFADADQSGWDKFWHGVDYQTNTFKPIQTLTKEDVAAIKPANFGEKYYVNDAEEKEVYNFCKTEIAAGNRPVLFRFAKTDYYASAARFDKNGNGLSSVDGYVAKQTVFLDFDIISLTFRVDGRFDNVLPVVSDPVDIIPSVDASDDVFEQATPNNPFAGIGNIFDNIVGSGCAAVKGTLKTVGIVLGVVAIGALVIWIVKVIIVARETKDVIDSTNSKDDKK